MFTLIEEFEDCVVLQKKMDMGYYKTIVRDSEGDIIKMSVLSTQHIPSEVMETAKNYSLEEIRRIKKEKEIEWRKNNIE